MTKETVYTTRVAKTWLLESKIIKTVIFPDTHFDLNDARELFDKQKELPKEDRVASMVDIRGLISATREARLYASGAAITGLVVAMALIVDSPVSRVIGNFFLGINKPDYPTRLFTSESEAIDWLRQIVNQKDS